jgi:hypothetical protein
MILVLLMASGANSSEEQIRALKLWMLGCTLGGLLCFVLGIVLTWKSYPLFGGLTGGLPGAIVLGSMIWLSWPR